MLSIHILSCVVCRSHSTGISVEDGNDSVDISKSGEYLYFQRFWIEALSTEFSFHFCICFEVHRLTAPQRNGQEHQLEKSISSHDQDETWNSIRKRHYQHTNPQPTKKAKMKRKQRQFDNIRQSAHDFNVFQLDYVDFGAVIGQNGAFSWHANYSPDWITSKQNTKRPKERQE